MTTRPGYIYSTRGVKITIDAPRVSELGKRKWRIDADGYVVEGKGRHSTFLHHVVLGCSPSRAFVVDHIRGNKLDNRACRLRKVRNRDNVRSRHKLNRNNSSGFKGVSLTHARGNAGQKYRLKNPWFAKITVAREQIHLGRYATELEAATAYDEAAEHYFGKFATCNLPLRKRAEGVRIGVRRFFKPVKDIP